MVCCELCLPGNGHTAECDASAQADGGAALGQPTDGHEGGDEGASTKWEVCSNPGCRLKATPPSDTCCDFCPRHHSWACLSRHTPAERETAEQHRRQHQHSRLGSSGEPQKSTVTSDFGSDLNLPRPTPSFDSAARHRSILARRPEKRPRAEADAGVTEIDDGRPAPCKSGDDVLMSARRRAFESRLKTDEERAIEAHDRHSASLPKRPKLEPSAQAGPVIPSATMPVSRQWVRQGDGKMSEAQLRRMIVEMSTVNKAKWSHDTIAMATGPRGSVQHVMAALARADQSSEEMESFALLDFGDEDDPLQPDWKNPAMARVLGDLREAKAHVYAEGSQPKLRTALNHWARYTATVARVGFLRPHVGDDPDAFLTESLLRQGFITYLVKTLRTCSTDTAEGYASLFNGWHIDTMGYGLVSSRSFEDEQLKRTKQALRRLHPAKKMVRAGHQSDLNGPVLRRELENVLRIYDEPGGMTPERWDRIRAELSAAGGGGLDRKKVTDLVYCALTELMTDGLLRPGEALPKKGFIAQSDVTFERDANGKLKAAVVMVMPIKQRGKALENAEKRPIVIKAHRDGSLRTAELLDILNVIAPCPAGQEHSTPAVRFPVSRIAGLSRAQAKSLSNPTMRKVMAWYHAKCEAAKVPHHHLVKGHSFRIAGATLLFAAGVTAEVIKKMGRWRSDIYEIYCRLSKQRLFELSEKMSRTRTTQFINGIEGFFDTMLEVEPVEATDAAAGADSECASEQSEESGDEQGYDGASSDSMSDDEFERRCGTKPHGTSTSHADSIDALFADED